MKDPKDSPFFLTAEEEYEMITGRWPDEKELDK